MTNHMNSCTTLSSMLCKLRNVNQDKPDKSSLQAICQWMHDYNPQDYGSRLIQLPLKNATNRTVYRFQDKIKVLPSLCSPTLLDIVLNDGRSHAFLLKAGEDLRQDKQFQCIFEGVSAISDVELRYYEIAPLTNSVGLLQWVTNTRTLDDALKSSLDSASSIHDYYNDVQDYMKEIAAANESAKESVFIRFSKKYESLCLLRKFLYHQASNSTEFFELRYNLIRSLASLSAVHYCLGIGDRHLGNFLLDNRTGEFIGIDFGYAFDFSSIFLKIRELVPFRLTSSISELLKPSGPAGTYATVMETTLKSVHQNVENFSIMIRDILANYINTSWNQIRKSLGMSKEDFFNYIKNNVNKKMCCHMASSILLNNLELNQSEQALDNVRRVLNDIEKKCNFTEDADYLDEHAQTQMLILIASNNELLSKMYGHWRPFI